MFLQPNNLKKKFRKTRKGKLQKLEFKSNILKFGTLGLKAATSGIISARQIEAARQAITKKTKRKGKIWIRIFPDLSITSKPQEARMGKGTGSLSLWAAKVKGGTVLFEICGIKESVGLIALKLGGDKLPVKTIIFK